MLLLCLIGNMELFFTCLVGNTELFFTQCRGIGSRIAAREKSHSFSGVVAGTSGMFSSYGGDHPSKLMFFQ